MQSVTFGFLLDNGDLQVLGTLTDGDGNIKNWQFSELVHRTHDLLCEYFGPTQIHTMARQDVPATINPDDQP